MVNSKVINPSQTLQAKRKLPWDTVILIYLRVSILSVVLFFTSYYHFYHQSLTEGLYILLAILFGMSAIVGIFLNHFAPGRVFTLIELCTHSLLVTLLVYSTGLSASPWLFLYLPIVMAATVLLDRSLALFIGLVSIGFYLLALQSVISNWFALPVMSEQILSPVQGLKVQILALISGMVLVSVAADFLKGRIRAQNLILDNTREELLKIAKQKDVLLNGLNQGVLIFDENYNLVKFNEFTENLLNVRRGELDLNYLNDLIPDFVDYIKGSENCEFQTELLDNGVVRKLDCKLIDSNDGLNHIVIMQDLTELAQVKQELNTQNELARLLSDQSPKADSRLQIREGFVGNSDNMKAVFETIKKVSTTDTNILITGESGTGKELVAKSIHELSFRKEAPFVVVNCGAIPENLIESQLFGHQKGSFTGAIANHRGFFEQAHGGTIFLDEIAELPIQLQAKLLRAIQQKTIRPIGSEQDLTIDVRILSATNKDLKNLSDAGEFREDLFYRLNVISIPMPALRERRDDIPLLIDNIMKKYKSSKKAPIIPPESMRLLMNYDYPGNIRELENILEHALVIGGEIILPEHLPIKLEEMEERKSEALKQEDTYLLIDEAQEFGEIFDLDSYLKKLEKSYLEAALQETDGVKTKAAELLGMNFRSFRYRLQKFGLND